jgi:predicted DNA-binding transcriptional regulator AlpA
MSITTLPELSDFSFCFRSRLERLLDRMGKAYDDKYGVVQERNREIRPKRIRLTPAQSKAARLALEKRRQKVRALLTANPLIGTAEAARRCNMSEAGVYHIRKQLGFPPPTRGRGLRSAYLALVADRPQITDDEAAQALGCSRRTIADVRRRLEDTRVIPKVIRRW